MAKTKGAKSAAKEAEKSARKRAKASRKMRERADASLDADARVSEEARRKALKRELKKHGKAKKDARAIIREEAREHAEASKAIRRETDRAIKSIAAQAAVDAANTAAQTAARAAQEAARHLSPRYSAPRPVAGRTALGSWDLHNHSVFSDGSCTVDELIAGARAAGLTRIAITDHDCLSQLSFIRARSRELSFPVLAGVEVSANDPATGRKVHVLGFGLEATADGSGPVERLVAPTLFARTATSLWQAWVLKREDVEFSGHRLSFDEVYDVARASTGIYKQHIMEALTRRPHTDPDYQFCYQCWFKGDSPANRTIEYPTAVEAVRAIREQGGVPVLAHPGQTKSWAIVPELVGAGLMGIEAFHPDHGPIEEGLAFELAERLGLFVTGGSDYHGKYGSSPALGTSFVCPEEAGSKVEGLFASEASLS